MGLYLGRNRVRIATIASKVAIRLQNKIVKPERTSQTITPDEDYDGIGTVTVEPINLQSKQVEPSFLGELVWPDEGYDGLSVVTVKGALLQAKGVIPSEEQKIVEADSGYFGLGSVTVDPINKYYVGSGVTRQYAKTVTPTKETQIAVPGVVYTMEPVRVGPIPDEYIIPTGTINIDSNGTYDVSSFASALVSVEASGGPLPSIIQAFDAGTITVSAQFSTSAKTYSHNLGVVPDFVMVFATQNVATASSMLFAIRSNLMGYRSSAYNGHVGYHTNTSTTTVSYLNTNSTTYGVSNLTSTTFTLASSSSSYYWRVGTYRYIAIKFM